MLRHFTVSCGFPIRIGLVSCVLLACMWSTGCQNFGKPLATKTETVRESVASAMPTGRRSKLKDPETLYLRYGKYQEHTGNYPAAQESYTVALEENEKSIEAILGLARIDAATQRPDQARAGFAKALQMEPNNPDVLAAVGQFFVNSGEIDRAMTHFEKAVKIDPTHAASHHGLGVALAKKGNFRAAFPAFAKAHGEAKAHYNIGYLLHEQKHHALAEQQFALALKRDPELTEARTMLVAMTERQPKDVHLASHTRAGAVAETERAVQSLPAGPPANRHSGFPQN